MMEPIGENYSAVLEEIAKMKEFATTRFGLDFHKGAYTEIDTGADQTSTCYLVYASDETSIKSASRVFGAWDIPCHKFDTEKEAIEFANRATTEYGCDTYYRSVDIHGSKDCQLSKEFLEQYNKHQKADVLFHEGFHNHCKINEIGLSSNLEEPIASWVGYKIAIEYLKENDPAQIPKLKKMRDKYKNIYEIINHFRHELKVNYMRLTTGRHYYDFYTGKDIEEFRKETFKRAEEKINSLPETNLDFDKKPLNNAFFLCYENYATNSELVKRILEGVTVKDYLSKPDEFNKKIIEESHKAFRERENKIDYEASAGLDNERARQKEMATC